MAKNWIAGATPPSSKGALHRQLGIPVGQTIPAGKIAKAASSSDPLLAKRATGPNAQRVQSQDEVTYSQITCA